MKNYGLTFSLVLVIGLVILGAALALIFSSFISYQTPANAAPGAAPTFSAATTPQPAEAKLLYNPPRPEDAPENIREAVMLGYNIVADTKQYAAEYTGNDVNCGNCHFNAGITQGGKNGGLSLVGVAADYPKYRQRQDYAVDMMTRINDCFTRSQNGKPLPPDSKEMTALQTYFQWISSGIPIYAKVPWLGAGSFTAPQQTDVNVGQQVYATRCSSCHGPNGEGTNIAPPVWGDRSYNDGAGMAKPETLASFAFYNMPRGNPNLTPEEAANVGLFVDSQPRPKYQKPQ